jgi:hypothetical protein
MTFTAQSIIQQAQEVLQDTDGTRWPATELVAHLNDGQRALVEPRPEMFAITSAYALVPGPKQTVPSDCAILLEVPRNTGGRAVTPVPRATIDAVAPTWYTGTRSVTIVHYMVDAREPQVFYVFPPAASGASVDLVYAAWPVDVPTPSGPAYGSVSGNINVNDSFRNALLHWVLARAFTKDAEFGGNAAMASAHMQLFTGYAGTTKPTVAEKA